MPIFIGSTKFNNEFRTAQDLDFLLACIGEKITVTTEFYYEDIVFRTEDNQIELDPDAVLVGTLTNRQELIYCSDSFAFNGYNVGDTIQFSSSLGVNRVITEKINGGLLRIGGATLTGSFTLGEYIINVTPFNGVKWAYNVIQGASNYNSLVDGELQQLKCGTADASNVAPVAMTFNGLLSYQIGNATVEGVSFTNGRQTFKLIHTTFITPWFLSSQWAALVLGTPPVSYQAGNCPNYVYKLELLRALSNPTSLQVLSVNKPANVGWFGETYNGGPTNYSISLYTIAKPDTSLITKLIFDEELTVKIRISNTTNTPFSNNNTKFCIHFSYLPEAETMYQNTLGNNTKNFSQNFVFDRKFTTVGAGVVNGDNFGTGYQVIKNVQGVFVSTSVIEITATIDIGVDAEAILKQGDFSRYMLWVTTENHALTALNSDKVPLLVQVDEFAVVTTVSDLIKCTTNFIQHPSEDTSDEIVDNVEVFPVDDVAAHCKFYIDLDSYPDDGIKIKKIRPKILLRKTGSADVILDDFSIDTSAYPYVGLAQDIAFTRDRVFKIPAGEVRKVITIARDYAADADNGFTNWYINWPFMVRWEYYLQLLGVASPIPADLIDITKPFNGINHFWHRFTTLTGWTLHFEIDFTFEQKGDTALQSFTKTLNSYDFEGGPNYASNSIKFYDNDTDDELTAGGTKFFQGWKPSRMEAIFNKIAGELPALENAVMVFFMEPTEAGGIGVARRISSKYARDSGSWFLSTDGSEKIVVTNPVAGQYKGVALINGAVLPANLDYTFYARLYDATIRPCMVVTLDATTGSSDDTLAFSIRITSGALIINWDDDDGNTTIVNSAPGIQTISMPNAAPLSVRNITICGNVENISSFEAKMLPGSGPVSKFITGIDMTRLESDLADYLTFSIYSSKVGDGDLVFPVSARNMTILRVRGSDFTVLTAPYNTTLGTLDFSNLSGDTQSLVIERMNALSTIVFNPLMNVTNSFTVLNNEALDEIFNFGTELFPTNVIYRCVAPVASGVTQANLDANIDNFYDNRVAYNAANPAVKTITMNGTNPAPSGTEVAPAGYIQADAVTAGSDGTPANAKEKIYVMRNQCNDFTVVKKYNFVFNVN